MHWCLMDIVLHQVLNIVSDLIYQFNGISKRKFHLRSRNTKRRSMKLIIELRLFCLTKGKIYNNFDIFLGSWAVRVIYIRKDFFPSKVLHVHE